MLEAMQHVRNSFVTFTYDDESFVRVGGNLQPEDLQGFYKRLRKRFSGQRIRHYSVGEYGDRTGRPHYHAAIFGIGCEFGPVRVGVRGEMTCHCRTCSAVRDSWNFGHTSVGQLEERSAAYIAGYVLKKMSGTSEDICRVPEFARMSLRPGIGAAAVSDVASVVMRYKLEEQGDVPCALRHGSSCLPLGRYLRRRLRLECGLDEKCPEEVIEALRQGLLPVFEYADAVLPHATMARFKKDVVRNAFEEINRQENVNVSAIAKIRKGTL